MKTTIVIPTYWRGPETEGDFCSVESDFRYDHATPLDTEGTLGRALSSLKVLNRDHEFVVAILAVSTRSEMKQAVELKVRSILAEHEYDFPIFLIGPDELVSWRRRLAQKGMGEYDHFFNMDGYSNIRNMSLLAAVLTGAEVAVLFDDDELYEDHAYLNKALEFVGRSHNGDFVGGVTGYYRHPDDGYLLPRPSEKWQRLWGKIEAMNEVFGHIPDPPRLKKTKLAFGGNMVIHQELFEKIPFDPSIPRGEDIDYLLNCQEFGYDFFLDNELWIRHLPPPRCAPLWFQMRQDIIRFARERAKLTSRLANSDRPKLTADDFDPYPGRFLKDDLHDLVMAVSLEMAANYMLEGREKDARECIVNISISKAETKENSGAWEDYLRFQQKWERFIELLPSIGIWTPMMQAD